MEKTIVGTAEAAELLGLQKSNFVTRISKRTDFPAPIARLAMGPLWYKEDILKWKKEKV